MSLLREEKDYRRERFFSRRASFAIETGENTEFAVGSSLISFGVGNSQQHVLRDIPRLSRDIQRCRSPMSSGGESYFTIRSRSSVQLLPAGVWLAWSGFAPFSPSSSPQSPLVDARERPGSTSALSVLPSRCPSYVLLFISHGTSNSSSPLPPSVQHFSFSLTQSSPCSLLLIPTPPAGRPSKVRRWSSPLATPRQEVCPCSNRYIHATIRRHAGRRIPTARHPAPSSSLSPIRRQGDVSGP